MARGPSPNAAGLAGLRSRAALPELLFLYECATSEPARLRPIADRLGLTVQAASYTFRSLKRRGLVRVENGRYRPTVDGVARLHGTLDLLASDLRERIERLHVVRSTRAVAIGSALSEGDAVSLEIRDGLLSARRSPAGPSRGVVVRGGPTGALVEVGHLTGIVPLRPATISVRTLSDLDLADGGVRRRIERELPTGSTLLAADGLEAVALLRQATDRPVVRFAAAAACLEASQLGVPCVVFVAERDLPRFLGSFSGVAPPPLDIRPVAGRRRAVRAPP